MHTPIQNALISVYYKDGLAPLIEFLHSQGTHLYSTGGTYNFIVKMGIPCTKVEDLTGFPEMLDGRVKTLHPKVFGGLLAIPDSSVHTKEMNQANIPFFQLMVCNLYPFEEYIAKNASHDELIEKIDIGGVTLIRAAAKNYQSVLCVADSADYAVVLESLKSGKNTKDFREYMASKAFQAILKYDTAISNYFQKNIRKELRYGENPHQKAFFEGNFDEYLQQLHGKEISYNNFLDIDAALRLIAEFEAPTVAILKHNNSCGLASADTISEAYSFALASDPVSAFGGVIVANREIDTETAQKLDTLFCEIIMAPSFSAKALDVLKKKKNRILIQLLKPIQFPEMKVKSALNGLLFQQSDNITEGQNDWKQVSGQPLSANEIADMEFAIKAVKHLKSNAIALVKDQKLLAMGCGMVSRIDALGHAIRKAEEFGISLSGATMASDAFFPFPDCVEIAHKNGIVAITQPGGSIKDQDSIDYCIKNNLKMVLTGVRHFNH